MGYRTARGLVWSTIGVALLLLGALSPAAAAAPAAKGDASARGLSRAPISAEYRQYSAAQIVREAAGFAAFSGLGDGLVPAPMDVDYLSGVRIAPRAAGYPASFDLRSQNKVSSVKDQGEFGACWAFATCASLESCMLPGELRDFSEDNIVLNAGFFTDGDPYDYGGNYWRSSAYLLRWGGPVDESQDAYGDWYTPPGLSAAKHVQEIRYIPGGTGGTDTANIKAALTTYGAVGTSISWQDYAYLPSAASFYYPGSDDMNHAVTIVGWDDNFPSSDFVVRPPGNGAWLVKNSWGTSWGESGYFWVSYYDTYCGTDSVRNAVFDGVASASNYDTVYQYDPFGEVNTFGFSSPTGWEANVFKAGATQSIKAVGFYAEAANTTYTVYVGSSLSALQPRGSGSCSTPGYFTVPLSSPFAVQSGSQFAVAVKVTTPGYNYPLAVEYAYAGYSPAATASSGQSFVSSDGARWNDLTSYVSTANACVKAYAGGLNAPAITALNPTSGSVGSTVTITGTNLGTSGTVNFGTIRATTTTWTPSSVVCTVPDGATGTVDVTIVGQDGQTTNGLSFTVTEAADTVGPVCAAKNVTVKRGKKCKLYLRVHDELSAQVTKVLEIRTTAGALKKRWSSGYGENYSGWWFVNYKCTLAKGKYRITVTGKDSAGNAQSVVGRAWLTVK